jgi:CheY-like chemotaxis protein
MQKMLERLIGEDVALDVRLGVPTSLVRADPGQIEQVVLNLVVNAKDAIGIEGGTITIESRVVTLGPEDAIHHPDAAPGPHVMLAVSDTGTGMTSEVQARVFEPFFTTKAQGKGTGLGLATVYGIVKQTGGHIWLYSEPGRGTTFKVFLPLVSDAVEPGQTRPEPVPVGGGHETILLVEDDVSVRRVTAGMLQRKGYRVRAPASPTDAIAVAEESGPIDLLITDVVMPEMSGPALAARLTSSGAVTRVLYLSGYTDSTIARHGLAEGEAFLQKPFTIESLAQKVRSILDTPLRRGA